MSKNKERIDDLADRMVHMDKLIDTITDSTIPRVVARIDSIEQAMFRRIAELETRLERELRQRDDKERRNGEQ